MGPPAGGGSGGARASSGGRTGSDAGAGGTGAGGVSGGTGGAPVGTGGRAAGTGGAVAGSGGSVGSGGSGAGGGGGSTGNADAGAERICQMAEYTFAPQLPTVYMVVDRSGSMFACLGTTDTRAPPCADQQNTPWARLRAGILQVVRPLQSTVRFGFAAFNGVAGGTCPDIRKVAPAVDNYAAIETLYNQLPFPADANQKWETPTRRTFEMIGAELMASTAPGGKYILFVTDGEPDYCDDANTLCPPDALVGELQTLKAAGVHTIVFGLQSSVTTLPQGALQAFANAGAGEDVVVPLAPGTDLMSIFDQCYPTTGWKADFLAVHPECAVNSNNCRGMTIGTYRPTAGPTRPYMPDAANQAQLVQQLQMALQSVKTCTFDLSNINGVSIKVDLMLLGQAHVLVEKAEVPQNATNGWRMNSQTELELVGTACTNWRRPETDEIDFQFPCSAIIFE
jgi:hypothetical protein